ncbi:8-amino-7-oxononanoate synthase [Pseudidiomarina gelatinasegens]|uniref:8-amino-7-oxononanoate synthase n=1 Tax=Pseudidiomarina gelatinasegens TaxID=2487740 RepID=UPI0030EFA098
MQIQGVLQRQLELRHQQRRHRSLSVPTAVHDFSGNDYLGLSQHPQVRDAFQQGVQQWGTGSGSSPLVAGYQTPHAYLRRQLSEWLERDNVLLFSSGFGANQCTMRALAPLYGRVLLDRLSHASLLDGVREQRHWKRFAHNDAVHAKKLLNPDATNLIVTESVFSMDGDSAPLHELAALDADLWVDDAHGLGIVGADGRSAASQLSQTQAPLITATFGKALGVMGAALVGTDSVIDYLVNYGREFIYSTAFPAAQAAAVSAAIKIVQSAEGARLRQQLDTNVALFSELAARVNIPLGTSQHAIQTLVVGSDANVMNIGVALNSQGFKCGTIRTPTVPEGTARLRITLTAQHKEADIRAFVAALADCYQRLTETEVV